ncbi:dihydrofolate reductase family protein [Nocardiopsis lambiniae]|uniref:Dihydrofolate reductase family protein n=1 Tax=Nocardiopsis lambiniae TaxID=3075539 RepID=A0ABU2MD06_9ACTN|nr:dihydrofolate reductase family protein [Nocardiopsis sp. DSM 44743]MDT0330571.1 dihydrofolate reductase family protein [Nocardiopsis sp. DSM 44743]
MRVLLNDLVPEAAAPGATVSDGTLAALYAHPEHRTRANMVATLDGAGAGTDGLTGSINTSADREVYTLLRDLADVVLVGAGTARAEDYGRPGPRTRPGRTRCPELAVVSRSAAVPPSLAEAAPDRGGVLLITRRGAGEAALVRARDLLGADRVLVHGDAEVDLAAAVADLAARGLSRVLCEGGPSLLADMAAAGLLDELCLTTVPLLAGGDAHRIAVGAPAGLELVPRLILESEGTLLHRFTRPAS